MNKNKYILLGAVVLGLGLTSCSDFLNVDRYFRDQQSTERIFSDKDYTLQWLSFCYSRLQGDNLEVGHSDVCPFNFSDDQVFNERGDRFAKFKRGEYLNSTGGQNAWKWSYDGIYQASILLNELYENEDLTPEEVTDVRGQARFLRAYFYWLLLRKFGPIPILPPEGADYTKSYDELAYPRKTYDECVSFITSELEIAATELFEKRDNLNIARPTKGAALAVRAKVFLYAASPLVNGNTEMADFTNKDGQQLIPQEYNEEKWAKAAAAARDMIEYSEMSGLYKLYTFERRPVSTDEAYPTTIEPPYHEEYSNKPFPEGWSNIDPFESYRSLFNGDIYAAENPELIFTRGTNGDSNDLKTDNTMVDFVKHQLPGTFGGYNVHGMTLKQSEAYATADGTSFDKECYTLWKGKFTNDENKDEHKYDNVKNGVWWGYTNREPRFYAWMAFDGGDYGTKFAAGSPLKLEMRNSEMHGYNPSLFNRDHSVTGFLTQKFVDPVTEFYTAGGSTSGTSAPTILFRLAELYLNVAECHAALGNTQEAIDALNPVRERAGIPKLTLADVTNNMTIKDWVHNERFVELWNEGHRFFDVRRWAEGAKYFGANKREGLNAEVQSPTFEEFNKRTTVDAPYVWENRMYLNPVFYNEVYKNPQMVQAP